MPLYRVSDLQAVEPDALPQWEGIIVEVDPDPDDMGFSRVDVVGDTRQREIAYVHEGWDGDCDPQWFHEYVVDRVIEAPMAYADYAARSMPDDHPDADRPPGTSGSWGEA